MKKVEINGEVGYFLTEPEKQELDNLILNLTNYEVEELVQ